MRRMNVPPIFWANNQLNRAVRNPPTCRKPVGLGAKRTRTVKESSPGGASRRTLALRWMMRETGKGLRAGCRLQPDRDLRLAGKLCGAFGECGCLVTAGRNRHVDLIAAVQRHGNDKRA